MKNFILKNHLALILVAGFFVRLMFYFFGAEIYYGTENFFARGDTDSWVECIINLIEHGTYSVDLTEPAGVFFKPPAYSFFIGIFYLISGKNIDVAYQMIIWAQIIMDTFSIWLIYKIVQRVFQNDLWAAIVAILYTTYPFLIIWTPVIYAETTSIFFLLSGLWFFVNEKLKRNFFMSGLFIGIAALSRLQIIFFFPATLLVLLFHYRKNLNAAVKIILPFTLAFILSYGLWPIRNYILHDRLVFSQDLTAVGCWDKDYMGFMDYVFAVQTDHEPEYSQIVHGGKNVEWPHAAYIVPGDSEKLVLVSKMCHDCGYGFNVFMKNEGLRKKRMPIDSSCSLEIESLWNELKANQLKYNKANFYLWVPLSNLKKCFFKNGLYKPSSPVVAVVSSLLFGYRTAMILLGLLGLIFYWKVNRKFPLLFKLILSYFILWYFWNSFMYRNMEMRFLLHADILMLIPAAWMLVFLMEKFEHRIKPD